MPDTLTAIMPPTPEEYRSEKSKERPSTNTRTPYKCRKSHVRDLLHPELIASKIICKLGVTPTPEERRFEENNKNPFTDTGVPYLCPKIHIRDLLHPEVIASKVMCKLEGIPNPETGRLRRFEESKKKPSIDAPTLHEYVEGDIWNVLHPELIPFNRLNWTPEKSTKYLEDTLAKPLPPGERAAVARLKAAYSDPNWSPDIIFESFADLDRVFFAGQLRGQVRIGWVNFNMKDDDNQHYPVFENAVGQCSKMKIGSEESYKSDILLSSEKVLLIKKSTAKTVADLLLHEMIHAYLIVTGDNTLKKVEEQELRDYEGQDTEYARWLRKFPLRHGSHFARIMAAINKVSIPELGLYVSLYSPRVRYV